MTIQLANHETSDRNHAHGKNHYDNHNDPNNNNNNQPTTQMGQVGKIATTLVEATVVKLRWLARMRG